MMNVIDFIKKNVEAELKKRGLLESASQYAINHYKSVPQAKSKGKIYDERLEKAIQMGKLMK